MRVKIKAMAAMVRLGRAARTTLMATRRCPVGLVQQLYSDINVAIVHSRINGLTGARGPQEHRDSVCLPLNIFSRSEGSTWLCR